MFSNGFEKIANWKHKVLKGALAASTALGHGAKAHADDMASTVRSALDKTPAASTIRDNAQEIGKKWGNAAKIHLLGDEGKAAAKGAVGAATAAKKKLSLDVYDASRLKAKYGPASLEASAGKVRGELELPKNVNLSAESGRSGNNVALNWKKDF